MSNDKDFIKGDVENTKSLIIIYSQHKNQSLKQASRALSAKNSKQGVKTKILTVSPKSKPSSILRSYIQKLTETKNNEIILLHHGMSPDKRSNEHLYGEMSGRYAAELLLYHGLANRDLRNLHIKYTPCYALESNTYGKSPAVSFFETLRNGGAMCFTGEAVSYIHTYAASNQLSRKYVTRLQNKANKILEKSDKEQNRLEYHMASIF